MKTCPRGIMALRPKVLAGSVVLWNLLMALGVYLNGSFNKLHSREAAIVIAIACLTASLFGYLVMGSRTMQKWALRPEDQDYFDRFPFFIIGSIALLLGIVLFLSAFNVGGFELSSNSSLNPSGFRLRF
jgi:hypothetical protein